MAKDAIIDDHARLRPRNPAERKPGTSAAIRNRYGKRALRVKYTTNDQASAETGRLSLTAGSTA